MFELSFSIVAKCARGFATAAKRQEINKKVSETLTGRTDIHHPIPFQFIDPKAIAKRTTQVKIAAKLKFEVWLQSWLSGTLNSSTFPGRAKRALIHLKGNKCEKCGWCELHSVTQKVPIELHPKDGDYTNNTPENLQLLCPNCHSLTPNYKALNTRGKAYDRYATQLVDIPRIELGLHACEACVIPLDQKPVERPRAT